MMWKKHATNGDTSAPRHSTKTPTSTAFHINNQIERPSLIRLDDTARQACGQRVRGSKLTCRQIVLDCMLTMTDVSNF